MIALIVLLAGCAVNWVNDDGSTVKMSRIQARALGQQTALEIARDADKTRTENFKISAEQNCSAMLSAEAQEECLEANSTRNFLVVIATMQDSDWSSVAQEKIAQDAANERHRSQMWLNWANFTVAAYTAVEGAGDSNRPSMVIGHYGIGRAGSKGGAGEDGSGSSTASSNTGDINVLFAGKGSRVQMTSGAGNVGTQENFENNAQNRPAIGNNSSLTPTNNQPVDDNSNIGFSDTL